MPWSDAVPELSLPAVPLGVALVMYALVGAPAAGWWLQRHLRRRRDHDPRAWVRGAMAMTALQVAWTVAIVAAVVLSPGLRWADLGLRLPDAAVGTFVPVLAGAVAFALVMAAFVLLGEGRAAPRARRGASGDPAAPPTETAAAGTVAPAVVLAARSRTEHRWALWGGAWAGIAEELLYRGFLVAFGVALGLPWWAAALLSCVCYAVASGHLGWRDAMGPALLGVLYMVLAMGSGSLIVPILVHVAMNVSLHVLHGTGRRHRAR